MRRLLVALAIVLVACGGPSKPTKPTKRGSSSSTALRDGVQFGKASWYGGKHHGGPTASGERFNKHELTAAHRKLEFGTRVRVTNTRNGRSVIVRINDRGPFGGGGRIIDLSEAAAKKLDMIDDGVVPVKLEVVN